MIDGEQSSPEDLHVDERLVTARKPKTINSLISPDKVSSMDPERRSFSRLACDFCNREVLGVDPYFPLKQTLIFAFRNGPLKQRADFLFPANVNVYFAAVTPLL